MIRVVIADDHPVLRLAVRHRLEAEDDIEVLAEAGSGQEAVAIVRAVQPDLVVLDYQMPNLDGLEAARAIHVALPDVVVVMLTGWEDRDLADAAERAGVAGFVLKSESPDRLLETIRSLAGAA
ncbi:MAG TPA: response regulator transcription factor [Actinomycetota bacterium]|nr:response regulator transcription factor [Actinomycetota bacterium]